MSLVLNYPDAEFENNTLTILDSTTLNRTLIPDEKSANEKYVDDEKDKSALLEFHQKLQNQPWGFRRKWWL